MLWCFLNFFLRVSKESGFNHKVFFFLFGGCGGDSKEHILFWPNNFTIPVKCVCLISAAAKTQKEKVQTSSDSSCRENPITAAAQTDQAKDDNSEKPDAGRQGCLASNKDNPASADSAASQVLQAEEAKSGQPSIVSDNSQVKSSLH